MSSKQNPTSNQEGEISDQQLDSVSGGQQIQKMEKITITATRLPAQQAAKDKPVVTAQKDKNTQVASAEGFIKVKN